MNFLLLYLAAILSTLPLTALFAASWFIPLALLVYPVVLLMGAVLRKFFPKAGIHALLQVFLILLGFIVLSAWGSAGILNQMFEPGGQSTLDGAQAEVDTGFDPGNFSLLELGASINLVLTEAVRTLSSSYPPLPQSTSLVIVFAAVFALHALMLDTLLTDLRSKVLTAFAAIVTSLIPAVHLGQGIESWHFFAPLLSVILIYLTRINKPADFSRNEVWGKRRALALACALLLGVGGVGIAKVTAPQLSFGIKPALPLNLQTLHSWSGNTAGSGPKVAGAPGAVMINDYISMRQYLNESAERQVLSYRDINGNAAGEYLRMRVLTEFDGVNFVLPDQAEVAAALKSPDSPTDTAVDERWQASPVSSRQLEITVDSLITDRLPHLGSLRGLAGSPDFLPKLLPSSFGEVAMRGGNLDLSGIDYQLAAALNNPSAAQLGAIEPADLALDPNSALLIHRSQIPNSVSDLAEEIIAREQPQNIYETALAFQKHLRSFDYSLNEVTPAGVDPLEYFLERQVGYCEQFAGVFTLMMQAQGFPTRVVLGFNSGTPIGENEYSVTNRNAHAWPEVWFGPEFGWIRFEPTPAAGGTGVVLPAGYAQTDANRASQNPQVTGNAAGEEAITEASEPAQIDSSQTNPADSSAIENTQGTSNTAQEQIIPENPASESGSGESENVASQGGSVSLSRIATAVGAVGLLFAIYAGLAYQALGYLVPFLQNLAQSKALIAKNRSHLRWFSAILNSQHLASVVPAAIAAWHEIAELGAKLGVEPLGGENPVQYLERLQAAPLTAAAAEQLAKFQPRLLAALFEPAASTPAQAVQRALEFKAQSAYLISIYRR